MRRRRASCFSACETTWAWWLVDSCPRIWIGTAHLDRLLTYPDVRYLSACSLPIRVFVTYPDVRNLSALRRPKHGFVSRSAAMGHRNVASVASRGNDIREQD